MSEANNTSDGRDPRRTEIGNRVDPSLAKGLVRQMLERAQLQMKMPRMQELGHFKNPKARKRTIDKLKKNYGRKFISAIASTDYYLADIALFQLKADKSIMGVVVARFDFRDRTSMPENYWSLYPLQSLGTCAFLTEHAMIRLAQRGGAKTFDDFLVLMKPFWAWASVAHEVGQVTQRDFHWFLPVRSGLFAITTETSIVEGEVFTVSTAKTYIDKSDMRPSNNEVWERLADLAIIDKSPRFPRLAVTNREQIGMLAEMISEGKKWYDRFEYAVEKQGEQNPDLFA